MKPPSYNPPMLTHFPKSIAIKLHALQRVYPDQVSGLLCHNMHVTLFTDSTVSRAAHHCKKTGFFCSFPSIVLYRASRHNAKNSLAQYSPAFTVVTVCMVVQAAQFQGTTQPNHLQPRQVIS